MLLKNVTLNFKKLTLGYVGAKWGINAKLQENKKNDNYMPYISHNAHLCCLHHSCGGVSQQFSSCQQLLRIVHVHFGFSIRPHGIHQVWGGLSQHTSLANHLSCQETQLITVSLRGNRGSMQWQEGDSGERLEKRGFFFLAMVVQLCLMQQSDNDAMLAKHRTADKYLTLRLNFWHSLILYH